VDVRGMVCVVFWARNAVQRASGARVQQRKRHAHGREEWVADGTGPSGPRSWQEGSVAEGYIPSWGVGEESSEECSPCLSWNQQRMLNSDSQR